MAQSRRVLFRGVALLVLSGCAGTIGEGDAEGGIAGKGTCASDSVPKVRPALRRLTRFEYNNTVRDLLGDTTQPAFSLPSEEIGNGFGNDTEGQSVSSLLVEQYGAVAEGVAQRATATPEALVKLAPCAGTVTTASESDCARTLIERFATRAYRRPLREGELDELLLLHQGARTGATFASGISSVIQAVIQSPDFLYRVEEGVEDPRRPGLRRPTGHEMASRLSYFLWGTMPDEALFAAAAVGQLDSPTDIYAQAERMLADPRSHQVVRFFFDNLLPITGLADAHRDDALFPAFTPTVGALLREETQRFLEHEIFEGPGTWQNVLTAPYTFVNEPLAAFYGLPGVQGDAFRKVPLNTDQLLGLLTQAGVMLGTTHSNTTNPVTRGAFIARKLMCQTLALPTGDILDRIKPPDPYSGKTARERFSAHSQDPVCSGCHRQMDPVGLPFETFDAVGLYRTQENGVTIDTSGGLPGGAISVSGPLELVREIAASEQAQNCFANHWINFAYGLTAGSGDSCARTSIEEAFRKSGNNVKALLLTLTQSDAFLLLPEKE